MDKTEIQQLISQGRLSDALQALYGVLPARLQNDVLMLQSRLSALEREERLGLTDSTEQARKRNQISYAALDMLREAGPPAAPSPVVQTHHGSGDNVGGDKIATHQPASPPSPAAAATQGAKSILFAAADPSDQARIQTDVEHRTIREEMQKGEHRAAFVFLPVQLAVRITELMRGFKARPDIIHFAGHGTAQGILVSNDRNETQLLNDAVIQRLFKPLQGNTELVLLNSCYSAQQAKLISQYGIIVIGHNLPVGDTAAVSFAKGFYLGLSEGMGYEEAYNDGIIAVLAENSAFAEVIEAWKDGERLEW